MELPKYKSHKTVQALEIAEVDGNSILPVDEAFEPIDCDVAMFTRYTPKPGDFYVVYEDGYKSFSPRKAFLEGYTCETQVHLSGSQT